MQIIAALFIDEVASKPVGTATHMDLLGVQFSGPAPQPVPFTWTPHLLILLRADADEPGSGALEVTFHHAGEQVARNVQPLQVEPGKFGRYFVRPEIDLSEYGTVEAHCRIDAAPELVVPYTFFEPLASDS